MGRKRGNYCCRSYDSDYMNRPDETSCRMYHIGACKEFDDDTAEDQDDVSLPLVSE